MDLHAYTQDRFIYCTGLDYIEKITFKIQWWMMFCFRVVYNKQNPSIEVNIPINHQSESVS